MALPSLLIFIGALLLGLALVFTLIFALIALLAKRRADAAKARFPGAVTIVSANFFGQESLGMAQVRGNGTLVLTNSELFFEKWAPHTEYHIPLRQITQIETVPSFLGKGTSAGPLLKVVYQDDRGGSDAIAWLLRDVEGFKRQIESRL
ncbi:MAG: hypothetical protein GYB68_00600 [Chloroflexi bacterium]|nr:hypothetical protein [Chloroflexota bacterium]